MITPNGYSKDPTIPPEAIVVTCGMQMIEEKGGLKAFIPWFKSCFEDENSWWLHKCKNQPKHDILYVYVIIAGRIRYRLNYGGWYRKAQSASYSMPDQEEPAEVEWPHILLAGPLVHAPEKLFYKGFQGFRYATKLF